MGVADNRTYKNEYHFNQKHGSIYQSPGDTAEENPSINVDPKINSTIKENPYRSNVEIEGKEVVLLPDLSALFNAKGKRHSQGGMDVLLKPNSFIFSDYEGLKLSPKDHQLFELKEGGKTASNTPADVLKRNVNLKHYNGLVTNLGDPFKDDLAKKSSARMLEKYIGTLGNIAFIQENKKGMPQGVPDFAQGSAPVYNDELKDELMQNKQYAKAGGTINNPYATGGPFDAECPCGKDATGKCIPCTPAQLQELSKKAVKGTLKDVTGMNKIGTLNNTDYYHSGTDPLTTKVNQAIPGGNPNKGWAQAIQAMIDKGATLDQLVAAGHGTKEGLLKLFKFNTVPGTDKLIAIDNPVVPPTTPVIPKTPPAKAPDTPITPGDVTPQTQAGKSVNWRFTPWQKASHMNDLFSFLNVDKYGAAREHYNATYTNPALMNPEQTVADTKALANQQITAANSLNPILRNAQAADAYGKVLNTIPGIRSQYDNQNVGIVNQFRQYNNQVKNNESLVNAQNDMNYFRDATTAEVNYKNMKDHLKNQALSNLMGDVSTNQKLAYNLLSQNNPAYGFDWNTGNFYRNPKNILDASTDARGDYLADFVSKQVKDWDKMSIDQRNALLKILVAKGFTPSQSLGDNGFKKGGKVKNPYK